MERIAKLAAFSTLALALAAPIAQAQQAPAATDHDAQRQDAVQAKAQAQAAHARAFLEKILTPHRQDGTSGARPPGRTPEESAAHSRAVLEAFFHKTPGQAARSIGRSAASHGAAAAGAVREGLLRLKGKLAEKDPASPPPQAPSKPKP